MNFQYWLIWWLIHSTWTDLHFTSIYDADAVRKGFSRYHFHQIISRTNAIYVRDPLIASKKVMKSAKLSYDPKRFFLKSLQINLRKCRFPARINWCSRVNISIKIIWRNTINSLSANPTKLPKTLRQFVGCCRRIAWVCLTNLWDWRLKS